MPTFINHDLSNKTPVYSYNLYYNQSTPLSLLMMEFNTHTNTKSLLRTNNPSTKKIMGYCSLL